jgi:hypothetical protein
MKYLVFNAVVFLALGYLITGANSLGFGDSVTQNIEKPKVKNEVKLENTQSTPIVSELVKPVEEKQLPKKTQFVKGEEETTSPPPLPVALNVAKVEPKKAPSRQLEDGASTTPAVPISVEETQPVTEEAEATLMNAKERSQALRQMVAEMEQMFARKMTQ